MKKQLTAILTAAFLLSTFTGCNTAPTSSDGEISDSQPEASSSSKKIYSTSSLTDSFSLPPKVESEPEPEVLNPFEKMSNELFGDATHYKRIDITSETEWVKDDFDYNLALSKREMFFPDGTPFDSSEATSASGLLGETIDLGFDFAYVRYSRPIYYSCTDKSEVYKMQSDIEPDDFFKVKAGDTLSNGLTVKKTVYRVSYGESPSVESVSFDGEIILKGTLILDYGFTGTFPIDELCVDFIPDRNSKGVPTISNEYTIFSESDNYVLSDFNSWRIINQDDVMDLFANGNTIEVNATLKDLRMSYGHGSGPDWRQYANIVSCELLEGE